MSAVPELNSHDANEVEATTYDNVVELHQPIADADKRAQAIERLNEEATAELEGVKPNSAAEKEIMARYQQRKRDLYPPEGTELAA